jgi:hypothetical protein
VLGTLRFPGDNGELRFDIGEPGKDLRGGLLERFGLPGGDALGVSVGVAAALAVRLSDKPVPDIRFTSPGRKLTAARRPTERGLQPVKHSYKPPGQVSEKRHAT